MESRWTAEEQAAIREQAEKSADLPRRRPGTHWTGPSGEHVEVPLTPRTVANIARRLGRIT